MMNFSFLCTLTLSLIFYHSSRVNGESEKCLKVLLPNIRKCDSEIARIDQYCIQGYRNINKKCKGIDTEHCALTFRKFTASCKKKRELFSNKCKPLYDGYKKECGEMPASYYQKVGPESFRCLKVLTPQVEVCDSKIAIIDKQCRKEYEKIDKECKGKDTDECGNKYKNIKKICLTKRKNFFQSCNPTYQAYQKECKGSPAVYPPPTGPESDRCLKDLIPKVQACDKMISEIDKYCNKQYHIVDELCKGKDTDECGLKFKNIQTLCKNKRKNYKSKCGPIYGAYNKECKGDSVAKRPTTGPDSDRCLKELIPGIKNCDKKASKIEKFCKNGFKKIDSICKGQDTNECDLKYKKFKILCEARLNKYKKVCGIINIAYKNECTGASIPSVSAGVDISNCSHELVQSLDVCDDYIYHIDSLCYQGFIKIEKKCEGKRTEKCGIKFRKWTDSCKERRQNFWKICSIIYEGYFQEYAKVHGNSAEFLKKRLYFESVKLEESIKAITPAKSTKSAAIKIPQISIKQSTKSAKSVKYLTATKNKTIIKTTSKSPIPVPLKVIIKPPINGKINRIPYSTCRKSLVLSVTTCDIRTTKLDEYCSSGYKSTHQLCKRVSKAKCGLSYYKLTTICKAKRENLRKTCQPIYDEYQDDCEGQCLSLTKTSDIFSHKF